MADDGIGLAEALLGLAGLPGPRGGGDRGRGDRHRGDDRGLHGLRRCGVRAEAQDRRPVHLRDLPCFGRPARLVWIKRRWRCPDTDCDARTWTEHSDHIDAQAVLTRRAGRGGLPAGR